MFEISVKKINNYTYKNNRYKFHIESASASKGVVNGFLIVLKQQGLKS